MRQRILSNISIQTSKNLGGGIQRYNSLDKLKVLCAFLIVCIHAHFPGEFGDYFTALTRIAVPIFFMISGFFFQAKSARRQIKKLLLLLLAANGIYLIWKIGVSVIKNEIIEYISVTFTIKNIIKFLALNETHLQSHLWYLGAILYVVTIITALFRINEKLTRRILCFVTPLLLLGDLALGKYSLLLFHREFPAILVRNWLFVGLPYFSIGMLIREHRDKADANSKMISQPVLLILIVFSALSSLAERYVLETLSMNATRDHYFSTSILAVAVFLYFLNYVNDIRTKLSQIGEKDATWIYIIHPILITVLGALVSKVGIEEAYNYVRPIVVFLMTLMIVDIAMMVKIRFPIVKRK